MVSPCKQNTALHSDISPVAVTSPHFYFYFAMTLIVLLCPLSGFCPVGWGFFWKCVCVSCEVDAVNICPLLFRCVQQRRPCFCGRGYNGQRASSPVQLGTQSSRYDWRHSGDCVCLGQQKPHVRARCLTFRPACCFSALCKLQGWFRCRMCFPLLELHWMARKYRSCEFDHQY